MCTACGTVLESGIIVSDVQVLNTLHAQSSVISLSGSNSGLCVCYNYCLFSLRRMLTVEAQQLAPLFQLIGKEEEEIILEVIKGLIFFKYFVSKRNRSLQFWRWSGVSGNHFEECEEKDPGSCSAIEATS